jgi:ribose transport system permease protein
MSIADRVGTEVSPKQQWSRSVDLRYRWASRYRIGWYALLAASVLVAIFQSDAYSSASRELITALAGCLIVASLGQLLVVMVGAIDLAVPGYMTLSAAVNVHFVGSEGPVTAFLIGLVTCIIVSAVAGALVSLLRLNALVVTLAINTMITGGLIIWMGQTFSTGGQAPAWLRSLGRADVGHLSTMFVIALGFSVVVALLVHRTRVGRQVAATGANPAAAQILGIRVHVVYILTFAAAGLLYALAGSMLAGFVQAPDSTLGTPYQLQTLIAVAIAGATFGGGPASVSPLVAGCVLLPLIDQSLALHHLSPGLRVVIQGALLVAAVAASSLTQLGRTGLKRLLRAPAIPSDR